MPNTIRGWCPTCGSRHDAHGLFIAPVGTQPDDPGWVRVGEPLVRVAHPSSMGCLVHGIQRCTICIAPPCPCECNSGGFCGGCGHNGCGRR